MTAAVVADQLVLLIKKDRGTYFPLSFFYWQPLQPFTTQNRRPETVFFIIRFTAKTIIFC
jgi:hypothetical protein